VTPRETSDIDRTIGALVRARRIFLGVTQTALGNELGLTFQQIQKYENGVNRISAARLKEIAEVLRVPLSYFFQDKDVSISADHPSPIDLLSTALNLRMLRAFSQISDPDLREGLVKLVESTVLQDPPRK